MSLFANRIYSKTITSLPTLILFLVVILGLNINIIYKNYDFIINFSYIIVFFWSLKKPEHLGYGLIFFAGIINDVVQSLPIGISSLDYLLLSAIGAFIRNRSIIYNLIYDWISFFIAILIVGSVNYIILITIFKIPIGLLLQDYTIFKFLKSKNMKFYLTKIELENGKLHLKEE